MNFIITASFLIISSGSISNNIIPFLESIMSLQSAPHIKTFLDAWIAFSLRRPDNNVGVTRKSEGTYVCEDGEITFFHQSVPPHTVLIHRVYIDDEKQRKGIFSNFLKSLLENNDVRMVAVLGVGTQEMINCLVRFSTKYQHFQFIDHGGDFVCNKDHLIN